MRQKFLMLVPALLLAFVVTTVALAQSGGTYDLGWNTFDSSGGATFSNGGAYSLGGTAGQPEAGTLLGGTYSMTGGFWQTLDSSPTEVDLLSFGARAVNTDVKIKWTTGSERITLGYNVWRASSAAAEDYTQVNAALIPPSHPGVASETKHRFSDIPAQGAYLYKLEIVKGDTGSEWSKPVKVKVAEACTTKPTTLKIVAPGDQAEFAKGQVSLKWKPAACATRYQLVVRRESKKGHVAIKEKDLTNVRYQTRDLRGGNTYFWQARACNTSGCAKSKWQSFSIKP